MEKSQLCAKDRTFTSWLPYCDRAQQFKFSALISEEVTNSRWPEILMKRYTGFPSICCVASRPTTQRIIVKDSIEPKHGRVVTWSSDSTVRNLDLSFLVFTPNTNEQVLRSGAPNSECLFAKFVISVAGDAGIIDEQFMKSSTPEDSDDDIYYWNHYFLEILDTECTSVCRILATKKFYHHLLRYDPTELGGPWFWNLTSNKHYYLNRTRGYDGQTRDVVVEFLRESDVIGLSRPGPDWSVIQDIEFVLMDETNWINEKNGDENTRICTNRSHSARSLEIFRFYLWYNDLPTERRTKLNDIPGLKRTALKENNLNVIKRLCFAVDNDST